MSHKILVINPGSTSTKIAVFEDENKLFEETLRHTIDELAPYHNIPDQTEFRTNIILDCFKKRGLRRQDPRRNLLPRRRSASHPQRHLFRQRHHDQGLL